MAQTVDSPGRADKLVIGGGGQTLTAQATPTIDTTIYAAGQVIGGKLTLPSLLGTGALGGIFQSFTVTDKAKQTAAMTLVLFSADPSSTTFTNHTALTVNAADVAKIIGQVSLLATDYQSVANLSIGSKPGIGMSFSVPSGTTLYACLIANGTPTYGTASDLLLSVSVISD